MLIAGALLFASLALGLAVLATRRLMASERKLRIATDRLAVLDVAVPAPPQPESVSRTALRRESRLRYEQQAGEEDRALLQRLLADFRDLGGAEEAIFWRWSEERDAVAPAAWSTVGARPAFFDVAQWGSLVQWSIESRTVQLGDADETVTVAAAPIARGDRPLGVLSLTHRNGLLLARPQLKEWLPRLADQLAVVHELVDYRRRFERLTRQSSALLDAIPRLQGDRIGEGLARALCDTAIDVSGARGALLVRWDVDADAGDVHYATAGVGLGTLPHALPLSSPVADACRTGRLHVLEDARGAASSGGLYGAVRTVAEPGSVAVIPVVKDGRVLGAIVLEAEAPGTFTQEEIRPLTVLGAVVAGSLELAWSYAEVDKRSRTDPLTGLWNRLHFGEELQRMLNESDRYEHPVALVLVDIDHFKRVNDSFGHEAGDAVLKHVARILQEGVRTVDVCVRYGGEEIAMLLAQTESARAVEVAERLRARIAATPARHAGADIAVTASFGVAAYPETVKVRDQLFPSADKALYIAKHDGRNCVRAKPATKGRTTG